MPRIVLAVMVGIGSTLRLLNAVPSSHRVLAQGVPVHRYEAISLADRQGHLIELVEDLIIGDRGDDLDYAFGTAPPRVAVDASGHIYVADSGNGRIQVFDAEGRYLHTLGRRGQGPGEFGQIMAIAVAADVVVVSDTVMSRLSRWRSDGEHIEDQRVSFGRGFLVSPALGLSDGSVLMRFSQRGAESNQNLVLRADDSGNEIARFGAVAVPERTWYPPPGEISGVESFALYVGNTPPSFAASPSRVYVSPLEEYRVSALSIDGELLWMLEVPWSRESIDDREKQWFLDFVRGQFPEANESRVAWPERANALGDIRADGEGRLYVFPYVARRSPLTERPVDVYSAVGERLFAGSLTGLRADAFWQTEAAFGPMLDRVWQVAAGDFVYGVLPDPETTEWLVVRHRLVWR